MTYSLELDIRLALAGELAWGALQSRTWCGARNWSGRPRRRLSNDVRAVTWPGWSFRSSIPAPCLSLQIAGGDNTRIF